MREELREIHQLKKLLATARLTESDRRAIEVRLQELQAPSQETVPESPATGDEGKSFDELPIAPEEIEVKSKLLAEIVDRIMLLRAVWANTLSFEVARETEAWLKKLQEIAATMPREAAEHAVGSHVGLLTQAVQTITKPQISESVQQRVLPPSMPSGKYTDTLGALYWAQREAPERPREPQRPPGYIPDGLQSLVS